MFSTCTRPDWLDRGRIPSLDGLRGIAILFVLLAHGSQTHGFPVPFVSHFALVFGSVGVETFFVLSGFLITTLMERERQKKGSLDLRGFYWRRSLRIAPAYLCYLLVVAGLQGLGIAHLRPKEWIAALTYTVNWISAPSWEIGHVWSLSIEEHFYLLWPVAFVLLPEQGKTRLLAGCLISCLTLRMIVLIWFPEWTKLAEICTLTRLDSIAVGCLIALKGQTPDWRIRLDRVSRYWPLFTLILSAALGGSLLSTKIHHGLTYSLTSLCLGVLLWTAVRFNPVWLNSQILSVIGTGSYSLYLWQQLFLNPKLNSWWTAFPANLFLTCLTAWVSYRFVELPCLILKERRSLSKEFRGESTPEDQDSLALSPSSDQSTLGLSIETNATEAQLQSVS